jgi:hypothetical protein
LNLHVEWLMGDIFDHLELEAKTGMNHGSGLPVKGKAHRAVRNVSALDFSQASFLKSSRKSGHFSTKHFSRIFKQKSFRYSHRSGSVRWDVLVLISIGIAISAGLVNLLLLIANRAEEHVKTIKETKIKYEESLSWRPDASNTETLILKDLLEKPERTQAVYKRLYLTEESLNDIGKMSKLKKLSLEDSQFEDEHLEHLLELPLTSINVSGTNLTDKGVSYLSALKKLVSIDLGSTNLTDKCMHDIAAMPRLSRINLDHTNIGDPGLEILAANPRIQYLSLLDTKISAAGVESLLNFPKLRFLNLSGIKLDKKSLEEICRLLDLQELHLTDCGLQDGYLSNLRNLQDLRHLELNENDVSNKSIDICSQLPNLKFLAVKRCSEIKPERMKQFQSERPECQVKFVSSRAKVQDKSFLLLQEEMESIIEESSSH